jgi:hypothetical protein
VKGLLGFVRLAAVGLSVGAGDATVDHAFGVGSVFFVGLDNFFYL